MWVKFKVSFQTDSDGNKAFVFPDERNLFADLIDLDGEYFAAKYSGSKDLPIYTPPVVNPNRVITLIEFEGRFPMRVQLLLADPSLASSIEISSICSLLARRIALSQARTPNGDRGVDLENDMTKQGVQEAVRLGVMTQDEVDAVFK